MDRVYELLADFAQIHWALPHDILAVNEEYEIEEALLPLDDAFMRRLPPLNVAEFALPIQLQVAPGSAEGSHSYVLNEPEDWRPWRQYEGMGYVGVEEDIEEEWKNSQLEVDGPEENFEDEMITVDRLIVVTGLGTKRIDPVTEESMLLQAINPSSAPHIATMGLQDPAMPDSTPPTFGPTLERIVSHQQHQVRAS